MNDHPIIDCRENPLDLSPALNELEDRIRNHVKKNRGKPLVVMMGENHTLPVHMALQQALMARLIDPQKNPLRIAMGAEWPHNIVDEILKEPKAEHAPIPEDVRADIASTGTKEKQFLRAYQTTLTQHRAVEAHRNLMAWADHANISVRPVDAAWHANYDLYREDSEMDVRLKKHASGHKGKIGPNALKDCDPKVRDKDNQEYMRMRNLVIRDCVMEHIADTKSQVYFLPYGASHVLGSEAETDVSVYSPFKDSLANLFAEANLQTLPVLMEGHVRLPAGAPEVLEKEGIVISGLNSQQYIIGKPSIEPERDFLEKISINSGKDALQFFPDNGTKASFGYGVNHKPVQGNSLIPTPRPSSRQKIPMSSDDPQTESTNAVASRGKSRSRGGLAQKTQLVPKPPHG